MDQLTIRELLNWATKHLQENGNESPRLDAEVLLAHVLGQDRVYLYREVDRQPDKRYVQQYRLMVERRFDGEPVAYLTGYKEFMGLNFKVGSHVLIPRPDTELMVEYAMAVLSGWPGRTIVVDVGTGSGAVAISLAHHVSEVAVHAVDISTQALQIARANAQWYGVNVHFYHGDLLSPLADIISPGSAVVVCANLPYIPSEEIPNLLRDVREYEPLLALDGGCDGLDYYRRLVPQTYSLLAPGGHLLMEIAPDQGNWALELVPSPLWHSRILRDLAGRPRLVAAQVMV